MTGNQELTIWQAYSKNSCEGTERIGLPRSCKKRHEDVQQKVLSQGGWSGGLCVFILSSSAPKERLLVLLPSRCGGPSRRALVMCHGSPSDFHGINRCSWLSPLSASKLVFKHFTRKDIPAYLQPSLPPLTTQPPGTRLI